MKKFRIGAVLFALSMTMTAGCAGGSGTTDTTQGQANIADSTQAPETELPTETEAENEDRSYVPGEDTVKCLGRTYQVNDTLWLAYSGSGIEFTVTGTSADIVFYGDSTAANASVTNENCARFAIYVDGERVVDEMMNEGAKKFVLFEGEEERTATVRVVKLSETAMSTLGIRSIHVANGTIAPTEEEQHYIEFVGDSITCGYGVDDEDRNNHFSTATEDVTKTYAYKTAQALGADYSMVSISGYGVISGYSSDGTKKETQTMGQYYDKLGFSYANSGGFSVSDWAWGFEREPDVVVINLGTNDASYTGSDAEKQAEFQEGYEALLKQIREKNPNAYILCTLGLMGDTLFPAIEDAVAAYTEETGDTDIRTLHLDAITADEGYAADWHPTEATHTRAAETLTAALTDILSQ